MGDIMTTKSLRNGFVTFALGALVAVAPLAARAQHVVTEEEAAKLTLEALTAAPPRPVYRPIYRAVYHPAFARYERVRLHGTQRAIARVSYRVAFTRHALHRRS